MTRKESWAPAGAGAGVRRASHDLDPRDPHSRLWDKEWELQVRGWWVSGFFLCRCVSPVLGLGVPFGRDGSLLRCLCQSLPQFSLYTA